ncbi:DnaB-like helicase C-terminal domain-containing protein (plasmid) [Paenibacillus sp. EC2-1]|uniref:DnaB-like helicase C-terminal domain-containing protein n=1 Tax=Paenibacillus sp. EC2-1 TaxID=3388665 RepID=UPI003BEEEDC9
MDQGKKKRTKPRPESEEIRRKKKKRQDGNGRLVLKAPDGLHEHEVEMWETINAFERRSWSDQVKGFTTGFAGIDAALEGLQTGFHMVGGDSNIGKTSFIGQMAVNVATMNPDAYVIDMSLDDPLHDKISRIIASKNRVLINAVKTPMKYLKYPNMLKRRGDGLKGLRKMVNCYKAYDQNHSTDVDDIRQTVERHMVLLKEKGEKRRVVLFIDNFHDLTTSAREATGSDKAKYDYLAQYISDMATKLDIPIVCTGEFKKLNGFRRPGIDDLRESVKIKYEAKSVMLCYNEVSLKGEAASVYFEKAGDPAKQPVFEVKFAKNKYSKFKGRVFFEGYPEMAYFVEADEASTKRYNNVIYSNE